MMTSYDHTLRFQIAGPFVGKLHTCI